MGKDYIDNSVIHNIEYIDIIMYLGIIIYNLRNLNVLYYIYAYKYATIINGFNESN